MPDMCKPRKPRKGEAPGVYWNDSSALRDVLHRYCIRDGEVEQELQSLIGFISPAEQAVWELDQTINDRGVYIDAALARGAIKIDKAARMALNAELSSITDGKITTSKQTARIKPWLAENGCPVDDVAKGTLGHALTRKNLTEETRHLIELRRDGAHAASSKFETMMRWRADDGRAHGCFIYHGASTGRWSSYGIQLQNLKKPSADGVSIAAIEAVKSGNLEKLKILCPENPLSLVGDVTRATLCARLGHVLMDADLSGIEARITAWLASEQSVLDQWAKYDLTHIAENEPYFIDGAAAGQPRDKGKVMTLAFGFAGGKGAYRALAKDDPASDKEVDRYKDTWRNKHPKTRQFWNDIQCAAIKAVQTPTKRIAVNSLTSFCYEGDFLKMHLPSGRELAYPFPSLLCDQEGYLTLLHKDNEDGKWVDCSHFGKPGTWKGKLTENAVQAVARDLFAEAMPRLEAAGYHVVLHLHDEILVEVPIDFGSVEEFKQIITTRPDWAEGLPLAAKGDVRERFCKIKAPTEAGASAEIPISEPRDAHGAEPKIAAEPENTYKPLPNTDNNSHEHENTFDNADNTSDDATMRDSNEYSTSGGSGEKDSFGPSFIYFDENGLPYLQTTRMVRNGKKTFPQWRWESNKWVSGAPKPKIPYRLPELIAAPLSDPVFICEGEKDAINVAALGYVATSNPGGGIPKSWTGDLNKWFRDRTVYICEDNDKTGRAHVEAVAEALKEIAVEIRIVEFRHLREHGDVSEWIEQGGNAAQLLKRAKAGRLPNKGYELIRASDVQPKNIDWLWRGHLPGDELEVLAGLPGAGKSQIQCGYVACVTTGVTWPDGANGQGRRNVIMLTAEDTIRNVLVPRLIAAGADRDRVYIFGWVRQDDKKRNAGARALDHYLGSQAFIAVPRVGHLCVDEIEQDAAGSRQPTGRTLYTQPKIDTGKKQLSLAYRIIDAHGGIDCDTGLDIESSRIAWEGTVDITADEALAATATKKDRSGAVMFLMDMLSNGAVPKKLIDERAAARGLSDDQLRAAKTKMGVMAVKEKGALEGGWLWCLPQHAPNEEKG